VTVTSSTWTPSSWREFPALQQPEWPDAAAAAAALERLKGSPPLVFAGEARDLRDNLAKAIEGRAFLLQAGDCVESFNELSTMRIREKLKIMLQMSAVLTYGATLPVVKLGRIAGQFTKPRSEAFERVGDEEIPSFRGHMVHDDARTAEARIPDPQRMVEGYNQSAATLNLLRAFTKGGYADLTQVHLWNKDFVASSPEGQRYDQLAGDIERALAFMAACGIDLTAERRLHEVDVYTSHEGLLLDYEEGLTLDRVRDDSTSFLIPPIWDSSDHHKLLELCYEIVFEVELTGWHTDPALWPQQRDLKMFLKWFEVEFHSLVIDLCDGPIEVDDGSPSV